MKLDPWSFSERGTEYSEQVALFSYCNMAANYGLDLANNPRSYNEKGWVLKTFCNVDRPIPVLKRLFAIHNQGHGDAIRGARASAEGLKKGVPDLMLPVSKQGFGGYKFCGLYIELKRKANKTVGKAKGVASPQQKDWIEFLQSQGYRVEVCYGWEEARDVILHYLDLK